MKLKKALDMAANELDRALLNEHEHHDRCDKLVTKLSKALQMVEDLRNCDSIVGYSTGGNILVSVDGYGDNKYLRARALTPAREEGDSPRG